MEDDDFREATSHTVPVEATKFKKGFSDTTTIAYHRKLCQNGILHTLVDLV